MLNLTICDDELAEIEYLTALARKWSEARDIVVRISSYESAESFLFAYEDDKSVDILLLDIQMKGMDGVALARKLRAENEAVQIVFITGFPDFIAEGYDVSALHYLMKPVSEDKLFEVLDKAAARVKKAEQSILIDTEKGTERVPLADILYIEAFAHSIVIRTKASSLETKVGIGDIEKALDGSFVRCHRSYIVGLEHVRLITKTDIVFDNGDTVPLSRRLYGDVNRAFIDFYKGRK